MLLRVPWGIGPGGSESRENPCYRENGISDHRAGKVTKPKFDPLVANPRGLRLGRNPVGFVGSADPFSPLAVSIWGKPPFSRYRVEGTQAVGPACLPAIKPPGRGRTKTGTRHSGCCRGGMRPRGKYPGKHICNRETGVGR